MSNEQENSREPAVNRHGRFITLEGGEGAGKSTQLEYVRQLLEDAGKPVLVTREPGGTPLGEAVRRLLLDTNNKGIASDAEILLMFAARAEHLNKVILPALAQGQWVICDRFTDATYAYQGGGRGIPIARIASLENWVQGTLRPDLTLVLDVPVELGLSRLQDRGTMDRFEQEHASFLNRVRRNYLDRAGNDPLRYRVIDTRRTPDEVRSTIADILREFLTAGR